MTDQDFVILSGLISELENGLRVYQKARDKAQRPEHQRIFERMISSREFALNFLKKFSASQSDEKDGLHAFGSVLNKMYPDILFGLNRGYDQDIIKEALDCEEQTFKAMLYAVKNVESPLLKAIIVDLYPQVNGDCEKNRCFDQAC